MKNNRKKYISEDKKAFIALLYIFSRSNFKKFKDIYYRHYVRIKAFINNNENREFVYNLISLGDLTGEDRFTAWDASVNNYKQMCNDVIFDYNDNSYISIISKENSELKDNYWILFDYNTETHLHVVGTQGYIQIFDYKQNTYNFYNYEKTDKHEFSVKRSQDSRS